MKLIVLNAGSRLSGLQNATHVDRNIKTADELRSFVDDYSDRLVLLWHQWLEDAEPILTGIASKWPANLAGCVLFSSAPYANASKIQTEQFLASPAFRGRVHICSDPVPGRGPAPAVINRFEIFQDRISRLDSSVDTVPPFYVLEPGPNADIFTAQIACLLAGRMRNTTSIVRCLNWASLAAALTKDIDELVVTEDGHVVSANFAALKRALRPHPNQMKCPSCAKRGALKHTLEGTADALPVLQGERNSQTLKRIIDIDPSEELRRALASHIRVASSCDQTSFLKQASGALEDMFKSKCALFCKRGELMELRDKVAECIRRSDESEDIADMVQQIIEALSCDDDLIEADYTIRLAQAL
jgi:hypothetical protein